MAQVPQIRNRIRRVTVRVLVCMLATCAGCGDANSRLALTGKVTWHGKPVEKGSILLVPSAGHHGPKVGTEIVSGRYEFDSNRGPTAGLYRVEVRSDNGEYPHAPTDERPPKAETKPHFQIPAEYNSQSRLTFNVTRDQPHADFDLPLNRP